MLDRRLFLEDFAATKRRLMRKGVEADLVDAARDLLVETRTAAQARDDARADLRGASKRVDELRRAGDETLLEAAMAEARLAKTAAEDQESIARSLDERLAQALLSLPNLPSDEAPEGMDESANVVLETVGFTPDIGAGRSLRPHWELGETLGILDSGRSSALSGSMFAMLRGGGARLLRGLVSFALELNRHRYEEIIPPHFVSTATLTGTGHLPKFTDDMYKMVSDDLWAIPTGEVPLTSMHAGEILTLAELPQRYMAYTVCWRRESGSAGRDTRGLQRLHEFHKVELVRLCAKEQVSSEFRELVEDCLKPIQMLELPYRIVDLCAGDLTFSSERIWDIEVYAAGSEKWLEVSSVGEFGDFQARRMNSRFRRETGARPEFIHALNGSGIATPRLWAAIVEYYQRDDGRIDVPKVLRDYVGERIIGPSDG